jgi:uncharacterized alpha/beta hydrolase family protein
MNKKKKRRIIILAIAGFVLILSSKSTLAEKKKLSLSKEEKAQISNIEKILKTIELDGSSGIHNYSAIEEMLTNFKNDLKSLEKKQPDE